MLTGTVEGEHPAEYVLRQSLTVAFLVPLRGSLSLGDSFPV